MCVYKRKESKFWWYSIYKTGGGYVVGSTGKEKKSETEAVEKVIRLAHQGETSADRLHAMIDALVGVKRDGLPLDGVWEVYEGWARGVGRGLAETTCRMRRRAVERFSTWAKENWPSVSFAGGVNRACAAGFASWLEAQGARGKTRRNVIGDLGTVWEGLRHVRDDVTNNPWPLVLPADDGERGSAFTVAQELAVLKAAKKVGRGWWLACMISRHTGLRYGDVARLKWDQVDLKSGVIRLDPAKTARHGIAVKIPLCGPLRDALRAESLGREKSVPDQEGRDARAVNNDWKWEECVLPGHARSYPKPNKGEPGAFATVLRSAKVTGGHTFHSWRHTFRTRLAAAGVSDEIAKRLGGWTEDATAMKYDHDGRIKELSEAVEAAAKVGAGKEAKKKDDAGRSDGREGDRGSEV